MPAFHAIVEREGGRPLAVTGREATAVFGLGGMRHSETEAAVDTSLGLCAVFERIAERLGRAAQLTVGIELGAVASCGTGVGWGLAVAAGPAVELARAAAGLSEEGGVCVGPRAYRDVRSAYEHSRIGSQHRLIARRKTVSFVDYMAVREHGPLIGRDVESALLRRVVRKVQRSGELQIAVVEGPAGAGKTRLVADFLCHLEDSPDAWHVDVARCGASRAGAAFEPFVHMLRARVKADDSVSVEELGDRLERLLAATGEGQERGRDRQRAVTLARMLETSQQEGETRLIRPVGEDERDAAFEAYAAYVTRAAVANPAILVIEDVHRASPGTMELLAHLVQSCSGVPLLVLLTWKSDDIAALLDGLKAPPGVVDRIELGPLEEAECAALVGDRLDGAEMPADVIGALRDFADGAPGYLEEGIEILIDNEVLVPSADGWQLARADDVIDVLGRSHAELLQRRIDRLPDSARELLAAVAVAGPHSAPREMLGRMVERQAVEHDLSQLKDRGLIIERRQGHFVGQREIELRLPAAGVVVEATLGAETRAVMHLRAAQWMQVWQGPPPPGLSARVAHHFAEAGMDREAAEYEIAAALQALRGYGNRDAWERFRVAAEAARRAHSQAPGDPAVRDVLSRALLGIAEVGARIGELHAAILAADELLADEGATDVASRCRALCARGDAREMRGRYLDAVADFGEIARLAIGEKQLSWLAVHAASRHAMVVLELGRPDEARHVAETALRRWQREPSTVMERALGRLEVVLGHVASGAADYDEALAHYSAAAGHFERGDDRVGAVMAELSQGNVAYFSGHLPLAERFYRTVVDRCRAIDYTHGAVMGGTNLGNVLLDLDRVDEALPVLQQAEALARKTGVVATLPETLRLIAACRLASGDLAAARLAVTEAVDRATATGNAPQKVETDAMLARIYAAAKELGIDVSRDAPGALAQSMDTTQVVDLSALAKDKDK